MSQPAEPAVPEERSGGAPAAAPASGGAPAASEQDQGSDAATGAGRVPDFFIAGHEKCGTTALYEMLRRHPQIFMPDFKEPRFFAPETLTAAKHGGEGRRQTLADYMALFAPAAAGQLAGEASPQYLRSPTAAAEIARLRPDARVIAILREPASYLRSVHLQAVQAGRETERDLRRALALEDARREGRKLPRNFSSPVWVLYSDQVRYVEQLRRLGEHFPREQVLVLIYDDYRRENEATLRSVLRFLGVDEAVDVAPRDAMKTTAAVRFTALHPLTQRLRLAKHRPEKAGPLARAISGHAPRRLQRLWRRVAYTAPPPADERLAGELRARFKPEVVALSEYLDRDLVALWGYEDV
jgi:hypothetical protein